MSVSCIQLFLKIRCYFCDLISEKEFNSQSWTSSRVLKRENFSKNVEMMLRFLCGKAMVSTGDMINSWNWEKPKLRPNCQESSIALKLLLWVAKRRWEIAKSGFEGDTKPWHPCCNIFMFQLVCYDLLQVRCNDLGKTE